MPVITFSSHLRELWTVVRFFLSKFGRDAYAIAKEVVRDVANEPEFASWTDEERREYVVHAVRVQLIQRYGDTPGFAWVINFAIEFAVGQLRMRTKERQ